MPARVSGYLREWPESCAAVAAQRTIWVPSVRWRVASSQRPSGEKAGARKAGLQQRRRLMSASPVPLGWTSQIWSGLPAAKAIRWPFGLKSGSVADWSR